MTVVRVNGEQQLNPKLVNRPTIAPTTESEGQVTYLQVHEPHLRRGISNHSSSIPHSHRPRWAGRRRMSKTDKDPSLFLDLGLHLELQITLRSTHLYPNLTILVVSAGSFYPPVSPNRPASLTSSNWEMMYKDRPGLEVLVRLP